MRQENEFLNPREDAAELELVGDDQVYEQLDDLESELLEEAVPIIGGDRNGYLGASHEELEYVMEKQGVYGLHPDVIRPLENKEIESALCEEIERGRIAQTLQAGLVGRTILTGHRLNFGKVPYTQQEVHNVLAGVCVEGYPLSELISPYILVKKQEERDAKLAEQKKKSQFVKDPLPIYDGIAVTRDIRVGSIDEEALSDLIAAGKRGEQELIERNVRLAMSNAGRFHLSDDMYKELTQVGAMGVIKSVELYERWQGYAFSTYATWWIRQAQSRFRDNHGTTIRIAIHMHAKMRRWNEYRTRVSIEEGREVPDEELIGRKGAPFGEKQIRQIQEAEKIYTVSSDIPLDVNGVTLLEFAKDKKPLPQEQAVSSVSLDEILTYLDDHSVANEDYVPGSGLLTKRDLEVLKLRLGLEDGIQRTGKEVGERVGTNRQRIGQLEEEIFEKLRHPRYANFLRHFL